jgi:tungstate transport system permease protein
MLSARRDLLAAHTIITPAPDLLPALRPHIRMKRKAGRIPQIPACGCSRSTVDDFSEHAHSAVTVASALGLAVMQDFSAAFSAAFRLVASADRELIEIVALSLRVSLHAVLIAAVVGFPLGALLGVARFPGRGALVVFLNAMMGLPPVVVGLLIYLLLSNAGPLGALELLYSPAAMVIAQAVLVTPIVAALSRQTIEDLKTEYDEQLRVLGVGPWGAVGTLLWDARYSLLTVLLAGFGRAIAEVGAVIIVGGNIAHVTRTMTTAIALETSKGDLALALGLGLILITLAVAVNAAVLALKGTAERMAYA